MRFLISLLVALGAWGQTTTTYTLVGPATASAGTTIPVVVNASDGADTQGSAWQWTLTAPTGYTLGTPVLATSTPNVVLACITPNNVSNCILYPDAAKITPPVSSVAKLANGSLASYSVSVPNNACGPQTLQISNVIGVPPTVTPVVPLAAGPVYTFTVPRPKQDIDGDCKVTVSDVTAMAQEVLAYMAAVSSGQAGSCPHDQDGDGKCTVADVDIVVLKVLGLI